VIKLDSKVLADNFRVVPPVCIAMQQKPNHSHEGNIMSNETNNQTTDKAAPEAAAAPAPTAAPSSKKSWINGRTVAYTVAGTVAVISIGAAAWAMLRNPKAVEAVVDAAA
jgi:hypothetical protein